MKFTTDLTEFNRRMAEALKPTFHAVIKPVQSEDGTLLFRGPVPIADDPNHVGTHVAVSLDKDVLAALEAASPYGTRKDDRKSDQQPRNSSPRTIQLKQNWAVCSRRYRDDANRSRLKKSLLVLGENKGAAQTS